MIRFNDLPDKNLYPNWRARLVRQRIFKVFKFVVDFVFTLGCISLVIYVSVVLI